MEISKKFWGLFLFLLLLSSPQTVAGDELPAPAHSTDNMKTSLWKQDYLLGPLGGRRSALEEQGISLEMVFTGEVVNTHSGGIKTGSVYLGNIDLTATLDTEKAGLWEGGTFFVYILNDHGGNPTASHHIGDLQTVSNIETLDATRLYEMWYEHSFNWNGTFSVLLGQHDLNSEFNVTEYGGLFINSSFGIEPDISANVPVSIFAVAAPAFRVKWEPSDSLYFMVAVYDGDPGAPEVNKSGLHWRLSRDEGVMSIYEMGYSFGNLEESRSMPGSYKLGFWYHTDKFDDVFETNAAGDPLQHSGNHGIYFLADQMLLPADGDKGLGAFLQIGGVPDDRNLVDFYIGGGFHYKGLFPTRDGDTIGLGVAHASISEKSRRANPLDSHETTIELTYRAEIFPWLAIQPDLQIVVNPSADPSLNDAVVSLLRFEVVF